MELRDYLQIIGKRIWMLVLAVLIITVGTYLFTAWQPTTYDATSVVTVIMSPQKEANADFYQYGNYYSIQASALFTDTIVAWLQDPSSVLKIYSDAQQAQPDISLNGYNKLIKTQKRPSAAVQIVFNNADKTIAENLTNSAVKFVKNKANEWTQLGIINGLNIDVSDTVVINHKPIVIQNTLIAFVTSLLVGFALVFLMEYLGKEK